MTCGRSCYEELVCLWVLFVSFFSYGEGTVPLSESQPLEEQIVANETLPETEQTVLDYNSMLSAKGRLFLLLCKGSYLIPTHANLSLSEGFYGSLEFQRISKANEKLKWLFLAGGTITRIEYKGESSLVFALPIEAGLRYNLQPLTFGLKINHILFSSNRGKARTLEDYVKKFI